MTQTRRLAAILAADVAGYSRLIKDNGELGNAVNRLEPQPWRLVITAHCASGAACRVGWTPRQMT